MTTMSFDVCIQESITRNSNQLPLTCSISWPVDLLTCWQSKHEFKWKNVSTIYRHCILKVLSEERVNEGMDGQTDGGTDGWMDGRTDGWMDGWMDGRMDGWMDGWMDEWMDGWTDGWTDIRMDEWIIELLNQCTNRVKIMCYWLSLKTYLFDLIEHNCLSLISYHLLQSWSSSSSSSSSSVIIIIKIIFINIIFYINKICFYIIYNIIIFINIIFYINKICFYIIYNIIIFINIIFNNYNNKKNK